MQKSTRAHARQHERNKTIAHQISKFFTSDEIPRLTGLESEDKALPWLILRQDGVSSPAQPNSPEMIDLTLGDLSDLTDSESEEKDEKTIRKSRSPTMIDVTLGELSDLTNSESEDEVSPFSKPGFDGNPSAALSSSKKIDLTQGDLPVLIDSEGEEEAVSPREGEGSSVIPDRLAVKRCQPVSQEEEAKPQLNESVPSAKPVHRRKSTRFSDIPRRSQPSRLTKCKTEEDRDLHLSLSSSAVQEGVLPFHQPRAINVDAREESSESDARTLGNSVKEESGCESAHWQSSSCPIMPSRRRNRKLDAVPEIQTHNSASTSAAQTLPRLRERKKKLSAPGVTQSTSVTAPVKRTKRKKTDLLKELKQEEVEGIVAIRAPHSAVPKKRRGRPPKRQHSVETPATRIPGPSSTKTTYNDEMEGHESDSSEDIPLATVLEPLGSSQIHIAEDKHRQQNIRMKQECALQPPLTALSSTKPSQKKRKSPTLVQDPKPVKRLRRSKAHPDTLAPGEFSWEIQPPKIMLKLPTLTGGKKTPEEVFVRPPIWAQARDELFHLIPRLQECVRGAVYTGEIAEFEEARPMLLESDAIDDINLTDPHGRVSLVLKRHFHHRRSTGHSTTLATVSAMAISQACDSSIVSTTATLLGPASLKTSNPPPPDQRPTDFDPFTLRSLQYSPPRDDTLFIVSDLNLENASYYSVSNFSPNSPAAHTTNIPSSHTSFSRSTSTLNEHPPPSLLYKSFAHYDAASLYRMDTEPDDSHVQQHESLPMSGLPTTNPFVTPASTDALTLLAAYPKTVKSVVSLAERTQVPVPSNTALPCEEPRPHEITLEDVEKSLPVEIQTLKDCQQQNLPLNLISCRRLVQYALRDGLSIPEEMTYVFLGFMDAVDIQAEILTQTVDSHDSGLVSGIVKWSIVLDWKPSGDSVLSQLGITKENEFAARFASPWWIPTTSSRPQTECAYFSTAGPPSPVTECIGEKELASCGRQAENSTQVPQELINEHCLRSILPSWLLSSHGHCRVAPKLPLGWLCTEPGCGRLNVQSSFRHRRCESLCCQDKPHDTGYALTLKDAREMNGSLSLSAPLNSIPGSWDYGIDQWANDLATYWYQANVSTPPRTVSSDPVPSTIVPPSPPSTTVIGAKHLFTGNLSSLQVEASEIFVALQRELVMENGGVAKSGPLYHAFVGKEPDHRPAGYKHTILPWEAASPGIVQARGFLEYQCGLFGGMTKSGDEADDEGMEIDEVTDWGEAASASETFAIESICAVGSDQSGRCKILQYYESSPTAPLILMCLGSQLVLNITFALANPDTSSGQPGPTQAVKESARFTLVHGDVLMLFGKQFELHVERSGCCILLMASSSLVIQDPGISDAPSNM